MVDEVGVVDATGQDEHSDTNDEMSEQMASEVIEKEGEMQKRPSVYSCLLVEAT